MASHEDHHSGKCVRIGPRIGASRAESDRNHGRGARLRLAPAQYGAYQQELRYMTSRSTLYTAAVALGLILLGLACPFPASPYSAVDDAGFSSLNEGASEL
jgi:hypothetical protein